jgi:hypothetical protein
MTRICRKCNTEKPLEEFTKHKRMKLGYDTICLECNRKIASKWNEDNPEKYNLKCKRWYRKNRTKAIQESKKRYEEYTKYLLSLKENKSCIRCGFNEYPIILQFHHRDENIKDFGISEAIYNKRSLIENPEILKIEIEKCDLLCPNCHFIVHYLKRLENKKPL